MKIAVVGGGVGGLATALALRDRGHEVTVLEREAEAGGKVRTENGAGWRVELGPAGVLDDAPDTLALYQRLGLAPIRAAEATKHRFVVREGKLREVPMSPPALLTSTTLTMGEKLRLAREPFVKRAPADGDETVEQFARRRVGDSLAEHFVEPMISGVFAGDWRRLSVKSAFPRLAELERTHGSLFRGLIATEKARAAEGRPHGKLSTLAGGMTALPAALAHTLGPSLRVGAPVAAIARDGAVLRIGELAVDRVVLALPPDEAARLCRPLDAGLADAYQAIPQIGIAAVGLGWPRAQVAHPLQGFGFLVPRVERNGGERLLGAIWMTSAFPDAGFAPASHVQIRCMLGGAHDPEAATLSDEELIGISRESLRKLLRIEAPPVFARVTKWARGIPQYEIGHHARVEAIEARGRAIGVFSTGAALRGVGVNDVIRDAALLATRLD